MRRRRCGIGAVLVASWVVAQAAVATPALAHHGIGAIGVGSGGPIYTITAGTLECGAWAADVRFEHIDFSAFSDAELLALDADGLHADSTDFSTGTFLTLAYGVTDRLTVAAQMPYYHFDDIREVHDNPLPEVETEGDSSGLGDLNVYAFYRLWDSCDDSLHLALVLGLETPAGKIDAVNADGEVFESDHQPGSGSWDPIVGMAVSKSWHRLSLHASSLYTFVNEGTLDSVLGDVFRYDAAVVYRLVGHHHDHDHEHHGADDHDHEGHVHPASYHPSDEDEASGEGDDDCCCCGHRQLWTLDLVLELNGISAGRNFLDGEIDEASGGNVVFLSPGLRLGRGERWSGYVSAGIPVIQDQNPGQHSIEFRYTLGLAGSF